MHVLGRKVVKHLVLPFASTGRAARGGGGGGSLMEG